VWLCLHAPAAAFAGAWVNINPGGGGAFTSIGAGPSGILVAGSDLSGAYRSLDHGATWDAIGAFRGLADTHVSAVAFDPRDPRILYLGAEDGLYRSADGGERFHAVLDSAFVSAVAASPSDPAIVYAGCEASYRATDGQVLKSADRGLHWERASRNLPPGLRILELAVDPTDARRVFLLSGPDMFAPKAAQALYRSTDGGAHWLRIGKRVGAIADVDLDPLTPSVLYVTALESKGRGHVWKSTDGGANWARKAPLLGALCVKRDEPRVIRLVDVGRHADKEWAVWESRDAGESWHRKSSEHDWEAGWQALSWGLSESPYGLPKSLGTDLSNPDAIYWADAQFVFGSTDGGRRFANLFTREVRPGWWRGRGIDNVAVIALAVSEPDPHQVFAGSFDIGLWRSLDGGESWQSCNDPASTGAWRGHGGNTASIVLDPLRPGVVWATMGERADRATLVRSDRAGEPGSWRPSAAGLGVGFLNGLALDRTSPAHRRRMLVAADGDVYRSDDDGATWSRALASGACRTTAVDRHDGRLVYAGGEGGLWRSTAGGSPGTWERVGRPEMEGELVRSPRDFQWEGVHQIVPDPVRSGRVYVVGYGSARGLYVSGDRGRTWTKLRAADFARCVAVDPRHPEVLYLTSSPAFKSGASAAGSQAILRSEDGGRTWVSLEDGLSWPFGGPVAIDPADPTRVFLGSPGNGFQRRTIPPPKPATHGR
jgi:photosystem II stability/assembly factor-like uncharacterized protein